MSQSLIPKNQQSKKLTYEPIEAQGQCTLQSVTPLKFIKSKFILTAFISTIFIGFPFLFLYWYPKLRKSIYYEECQVDQCTHFYVMNYDQFDQIAQKQQEQFQEVGSNYFFFMNRYMKYKIIDDRVEATSYEFKNKIIQVLKKKQSGPFRGLLPGQVEKLRQRYGSGAMITEQPTILVLMFREVIQPLYIFIALSMLAWSLDNYVFYAMVILATTVIGIVINLYETYQTNKRIHEMAYYETQIYVLRQNTIKKLNSKDVVPGDIIFLKNQMKMPFDCVLLEGSCLMNQCALTGQSVPVAKKQQDLPQLAFKTNYLYDGTFLIQTETKRKIKLFQPFRQQYGLPAYVIRTNFATAKGQLIRLISYPNSKKNSFTKQSQKFLFFLFAVAIISNIITIIILRNQFDTSDLIYKFFDIITITVPPGLPISMTFGIIYAVEKMKQKQIFCISPNKVISGGLVDFICFDKTGTLTEDFMDFYCLVPAVSKNFTQRILNQNVQIQKIIKLNKHIVSALSNMAVNHSITKIQQTGKIVGDPMEIKLFQFGDFRISDDEDSSHEVIFVFQSKRNHNGFATRRFDFDSQLFRMSTVAKSNLDDEYYIYTKGSPEAMAKIFDPSTVPFNYDEILKQYASSGFRILAIGSRRIDKSDLQRQRSFLENDLQFDGFQVFENKLKPQTIGAIQDLQGAQIPSVMITGDNALTGSNISFECGIANIKKKMYICTFQNGKLNTEEFIYRKAEAENIQNRQLEQEINHENSIASEMIGDSQENIEKILRKIDQKGQLCLTGTAFNYFFPGDIEKVSNQQKKLLMSTRVFARAKPNDKAKIIMVYQNIGKTTAMCGDGANDCGALKQADIGLSLSQAQASISSPFTSKITNISSMVELIKECRAGLVTNYSLFNIMALYSFIQFTSSVLCEFYGAYPSDFGFLYWDLACNFGFFMTFGYTKTVKKLSKEKPKTKLLTFFNIISLVFMYVVQLYGQLLMLCGLYWFKDVDVGSDDEFDTDTPQTNILFYFANFMYISTLVACSVSYPWRQAFYTNIPFMILFCLVFPYSIIMIFVEGARPELFQLSYIHSSQLKLYVFAMSMVFSLIIYVGQKWVIEPLSLKFKGRL